MKWLKWISRIKIIVWFWLDPSKLPGAVSAKDIAFVGNLVFSAKRFEVEGAINTVRALYPAADEVLYLEAVAAELVSCSDARSCLKRRPWLRTDDWSACRSCDGKFFAALRGRSGMDDRVHKLALREARRVLVAQLVEKLVKRELLERLTIILEPDLKPGEFLFLLCKAIDHCEVNDTEELASAEVALRIKHALARLNPDINALMRRFDHTKLIGTKILDALYMCLIENSQKDFGAIAGIVRTIADAPAPTESEGFKVHMEQDPWPGMSVKLASTYGGVLRSAAIGVTPREDR